MSHTRVSRASRAAHSLVSPQAFVAIAEDAVATGDIETAIHFIEAAYQSFDESLDLSRLELAA